MGCAVDGSGVQGHHSNPSDRSGDVKDELGERSVGAEDGGGAPTDAKIGFGIVPFCGREFDSCGGAQDGGGGQACS